MTLWCHVQHTTIDYSLYYFILRSIINQILQMSSAIFCGGSTKFMVPLSLSLPLQPSFNIITRKNKRLVLDYLGLKGRRNVIIKASSDVASPSIWENWKPPKSSSFSDILWPSAGSFLLLFSFISKMNLITILCNNGIKKLFYFDCKRVVLPILSHYHVTLLY